jgi:exportin-T
MATMGPTIAHLIPALMSSMLAHFEPSELVDFMNFIGVLVHKLQESMLDMLDELIGPLSLRIMELLGQPVTGTDDQLQHNDTKRGYLGLLNGIVSAKLQRVFLSDRSLFPLYLISQPLMFIYR